MAGRLSESLCLRELRGISTLLKYQQFASLFLYHWPSSLQSLRCSCATQMAHSNVPLLSRVIQSLSIRAATTDTWTVNAYKHMERSDKYSVISAKDCYRDKLKELVHKISGLVGEPVPFEFVPPKHYASQPNNVAIGSSNAGKTQQLR
eukprot:1081640_1